MTDHQPRFGKPGQCVECGKPVCSEIIIGDLVHFRFCRSCLAGRMAASGSALHETLGTARGAEVQARAEEEATHHAASSCRNG